MNAALPGLFAFLAGGLLAVLYLAALWATVRRLTVTRQPGLWVIASAAGRVTLLMCAFGYLLSVGGWTLLVPALVGFVVTRAVTLAWVRRAGTGARRGDGAHTA